MLTKIVTWLAVHQWIVLATASAAILTAAYAVVVARAPESPPVEIVVRGVPVCPEVTPSPPTSPSEMTCGIASKPILYADKENRSFGWNKAATKLLETTHVIHIQYGKGYDVMDMRNGKGEIQNGEWPASWYDGPITIGIYNPSTGKYAVSVRVE